MIDPKTCGIKKIFQYAWCKFRIDRYHREQNILLFSNVSSLNSQFFKLKLRKENKNPYFSAYYFSEIIFNSSF